MRESKSSRPEAKRPRIHMATMTQYRKESEAGRRMRSPAPGKERFRVGVGGQGLGGASTECDL